MLKQLITALLLSAATALSAGFAHADSVGFFIAGGANYAQFDSDLDDEIDWDDDIEAFFDDKAVGYNLGEGYRFNKWLSLDAGYWDLGEFNSDRFEDGDKVKIDYTTWTVGGMVSVPLWILDIYARGGAAFWDADSRLLDDDGTDPYYGLGAALNIGGSLDLYLELLRFDLDTDIDTVGFGVRFTF